MDRADKAGVTHGRQKRRLRGLRWSWRVDEDSLGRGGRQGGPCFAAGQGKVLIAVLWYSDGQVTFIMPIWIDGIIAQAWPSCSS